MTAESQLVVDANVAVKWFVPERESDRAASLLQSGRHLIAPSVLPAEFGNVMRKKLKQGEVDARAAGHAIQDVIHLIELHPIDDLLSEAWDITLRCDHSFYDALYVALAIQCGCRLVTADDKLVNGMGSGFQDRFLLLRDVV